MRQLLKRPSAFIPLLISTGFLVGLLFALARGTLVPQPDENLAAHLFQILMPIQFLVIIFFAMTWLPKKTGAALAVLALQLTGMIAVLAIVYFRHL